MHRIDTSGAVSGYFTDGNPATAQLATRVDDEWLNSIQEEIISVLTAAGITPVKGTYTQLYDAIAYLIAQAVPTVPDATDTVKGKVELATTTEAAAGVDTVRAVTPAGVKSAIDARVASATAVGMVELATNAEVQTGTDTTRAVTPAGLASLTATESRAGLAEIATTAEVQAGSDDSRYVTPAKLAAILATLPIFRPGFMTTFGGAEAQIPAGYLPCDGRAISRTTYAALFTAIGTLHGVGNGTSTFNIPDLRGSYAAGTDNLGGTAANRITNAGSGISTATTVGGRGGSQNHVLTVAQMPSHNHTPITLPASEDDNPDPPLGNSVIGNNIVGGATVYNAGVTGASGQDQPHPHIPPTVFVPWIIWTGVV